MRTPCAALAVALLAACGGGPSLPDKPQIKYDKNLLDWGSLAPDAGGFGNAVYVGTAPIATVQLQNGGTRDLTIGNVAVAGTDSALFTATLSSNKVVSRDFAFVQVVFSPVDEGTFHATLQITSNAENYPNLEIPLQPTAAWHYLSKGTVVGEDISVHLDGGMATKPLAGIAVSCMKDCQQNADAGFSTTCATTVWTVTTGSDATFRKGSNTACEALMAVDSTSTYLTTYAGFNPGANITITMRHK
jgi:hypothetical protein